MPSNKELLELIRQWNEENQDNMASRYLRTEFRALEKKLEQLDTGSSTSTLSPGAKAAASAAKEGPREPVADGRDTVPEGRPAEDQPKTFQEASAAAHDKFMTNLTGKTGA